MDQNMKEIFLLIKLRDMELLFGLMENCTKVCENITKLMELENFHGRTEGNTRVNF